MIIRTSWLYIFGFLIFVFLSVRSGLTHEDKNAAVPSVQALFVEAPIQVDGVLDEPFWKDCQVATDFYDIRTQQHEDQKTVARFAYTKSHLYISVECFDDNISEIHASEQREDRFFRGDDFVEIHLDPTHSHISKYAFFSNPLGTRLDANEGPSGVFNTGWTSEYWDLSAKILEDRWVFEMSIPFSILNYKRSDNQTWGLNITRVRRSTDVTSFWSYNATDYWKPRNFGHLTGLNLADSVFERNWEFTPYISSRMDFNGDTASFFQSGIDASFRLTPSIITSWTLNPDFGQVEADDDTIELRDTERFLSEKRPFFREGEELLRMRRRLYYSRRYSDIETGAKVSGEWNDYKFSLLNIQGDMTHGDTYHGNSTVVRAIQGVGERNSLGYYLSTSELDQGHSRVASLDGNFFLNDDWQYRFQTSLANDRFRDAAGSVSKDRLDYLGYTSIDYGKYPWDIELGYNAISEGFDPLLGFIPRRDIFGPSFELNYHEETDDRWYKELFAGLESDLYENEDGQTVLRDYSAFSRLVFPNDFGILLVQSFDYHIPYDNTRTAAGFSLNSSDYWKRFEFLYGTGEFENAKYDEFTIEKNWKPFEQWPIRYEFTIRQEEEPTGDEHTVWLNRIIFDYYFTDKMWLKTSLQHRNNSIGNVSVIYGWEFIKNAHWYMAYNSVSEKDEGTNHSIFTKLAYTF